MSHTMPEPEGGSSGELPTENSDDEISLVFFFFAMDTDDEDRECHVLLFRRIILQEVWKLEKEGGRNL